MSIDAAIVAAAAAAAAAAGGAAGSDGDAARSRQRNLPKLVRYFSDFTLNWTATQMNQNVVYGADSAT